MANRTAWTGGNLFSGYGWNAAFNAADLNSLPNLSSVLSSIAVFTNGSAQDQYLDFSFKLTIASNTIAANANIAVWLFYLQQDGTILGDGSLVAGTQAAVTPGLYPLPGAPLRAASAQTILVGENASLVVLKPASFAVAIQNNSGFNLAASGNTFSIRTYNQDLNH